MSEWRKLSRLPESPDYWLGLRDRISRTVQPLSVHRTRRERWIDAALISASVGAAAVILLLLAQPTAPVEPSLQAGLAPGDPVAVEMLNSGQAPNVSELLPVYAPRPIR
jgi:hypothetical protein